MCAEDTPTQDYYFYASGLRLATTGEAICGPLAPGVRRVCAPDGTLVPRNNFVGKPLHRVDMRIQREFRLGAKARATGLLELFNAFNHANYGGYSTAQSLANYGQPTSVANVAYYPRQAQLGFRLAF